MRTRDVKIGMWVWACGAGEYGEFLCRVVGWNIFAGEWELDSPQHGHLILRSSRELQAANPTRGRGAGRFQ